MIDIKRVALEIKTIGLYDGILQEILKTVDKKELNKEDIELLLTQYPNFLEQYKTLNLDYNISNIHLKDIDISKISNKQDKDKAIKLNINLALLRNIEKFTIDFENSPTIITIMSIEFFVLFSVQYFIVLLDMKEWQLEIYTAFALSVGVAYLYAKRQKKIYSLKKIEFENKYIESLEILDRLEKSGAIKKSEQFITEDINKNMTI